MKKRRKLVVGNWKMNPPSIEEAREIFKKIKKTASKLRNTDVVICPPFVYVSELAKLGKGDIGVGVQNIFFEAGGAHTGEVGADMAISVGARYCILGHSERRAMGETDEAVSKKITIALGSGLTPVVCFGEQVRDSEGQYLETIANQLKNSIASVSKRDVHRIVLAYEPVWAVGKRDNKTISGREMYEMLLFIRKTLTELYGKDLAFGMTVIYGGSATSHDVEDLVREGHVDGVLPGRQSLETEGFGQLLKIVDSIK